MLLLTTLVDNSSSIFRALLIASIFCFVSCKSEVKYDFTQIKGQAQGTTFNIVYDDRSATDYSESIDSLFRVMDKSMSLWDSTSTISLLNESLEGLKVDQHFINVFNISKRVSNQTYGSFDITMGPLIKSWGFIRKNDLPIPTDEDLINRLAQVGMDKVTLVDDFLEKLTPNAEIDMNAVAQGYTVDVIASFLDKRGILNYLIEVGGEIRTKGSNQFGEAWKVGIEKPDYNLSFGKNSIKAVAGLSDKSLATSGSYRKFIEIDGKKYSHTIDPKTGKPVTHNLLSVSVIADDCASADAFATAFMVLGTDSALSMSQRFGIDVYCIYDNNGEFLTKSTKGFEKLLIQEN